jgi:hypothetical protein
MAAASSGVIEGDLPALPVAGFTGLATACTLADALWRCCCCLRGCWRRGASTRLLVEARGAAILSAAAKATAGAAQRAAMLATSDRLPASVVGLLPNSTG